MTSVVAGWLLASLLSSSGTADVMSSWLTRWSEFEDGCVVSGETLDLAELGIVTRTLEHGETAPPRIDADRYEELVIVRAGELAVAVAGGDTVVIGPGGVVVSQPGDDRRLSNAGDDPATYYLFTYRTHLGPDAARGADAGGSLVVNWNDVAYVESDIGGRRQIFDRPTAMFDTFEMHVSTLNGGLTNHPAHTHRAEEFVLIIDGTVAMQIGDETVRAGSGDLIYVESMIPHSLDNTGEDATTYFAFQFWQ